MKSLKKGQAGGNVTDGMGEAVSAMLKRKGQKTCGDQNLRGPIQYGNSEPQATGEKVSRDIGRQTNPE